MKQIEKTFGANFSSCGNVIASSEQMGWTVNTLDTGRKLNEHKALKCTSCIQVVMKRNIASKMKGGHLTKTEVFHEGFLFY